MATNRILEFTPSQEEAVVARILVLVHQAVDVHFPSAEKATRQFTKTVFSDDSERTAIGQVPTAENFGSEERTGPGNEAARDDDKGEVTLPPPPSRGRPTAPTPPPPARPNPIQSRHDSHHGARDSGHTGAPALASPMASTGGGSSSVTGLERQLLNRPDWITRGLLALLIAGLLLLAYSLFV